MNCHFVLGNTLKLNYIYRLLYMNVAIFFTKGISILGGSGIFILDSVFRDKLLHAVQRILSVSAGEQRVVVQPLISSRLLARWSNRQRGIPD